MALDPEEIVYLIRQTVPEAEISLSDLRGDGRQYAALIISPAFTGRTRLDQHRMVYEALRGKSEDDLLALSLQTAAPEEIKRK